MQNMKRMKANQAHKWPVPERIELLYRTMADALGPTGWWPAETTFEIMVGAVLTQNTAWSNVDRSLAALKARMRSNPMRWRPWSRSVCRN